jgi:hypothetical protein
VHRVLVKQHPRPLLLARSPCGRMPAPITDQPSKPKDRHDNWQFRPHSSGSYQPRSECQTVIPKSTRGRQSTRGRRESAVLQPLTPRPSWGISKPCFRGAGRLPVASARTVPADILMNLNKRNERVRPAFLIALACLLAVTLVPTVVIYARRSSTKGKAAPLAEAVPPAAPGPKLASPPAAAPPANSGAVQARPTPFIPGPAGLPPLTNQVRSRRAARADMKAEAWEMRRATIAEANGISLTNAPSPAPDRP